METHGDHEVDDMPPATSTREVDGVDSIVVASAFEVDVDEPSLDDAEPIATPPAASFEDFVTEVGTYNVDFTQMSTIVTSWLYKLDGNKYMKKLALLLNDWLLAVAVLRSSIDNLMTQEQPEQVDWSLTSVNFVRQADALKSEFASLKEAMTAMKPREEISSRAASSST